MRFIPMKSTFLLTLLLGGLAACNYPTAGTGPTGNVINSRSACANCGTVADIDYVEGDSINDAGAAIIGAVIGGIVGNQVGGGTGNDVATAAGAVGGAVAGQEIEEQADSPGYFVVEIAMYSGGSRTITVPSTSALDVGDEVRVEGGNIHVI